MTPIIKTSTPVFEEVKWELVTESRISTVISMLPVSLQSRINPFRSPRRTKSLYDLRSQELVDASSSSPSPSPSRRRLRPLSEADARPLANDRTVIEIEDGKGSAATSGAAWSSPLPPRAACSETLDGNTSARAASGIHWKYARQGTGLINVSMEGNRQFQDAESSLFERKAYLDGLTYLLQGLPQDLKTRELEQLRSALPEELSTPGHGFVPTERDLGHSRTMLHRAVQTFVVNFVLLLHLLLPYLLLCFNWAVKMERKYKLSEKLVGHGMDFATTVGRSGAILTERVCRLNDGKVGRAMSDVLVWTIDGITRGISDGVREGLVIVET